MLPARRPQHAFSLIELTAVLALIAVLIGGGLSLGNNAIKSAERVTTRERLNTIKNALDAYARTNGYLPCPTDRALTPRANPTTFGREIRPCAAAAPGLVRTSGIDIGGVPVRTLGLPDAYAADAWDRKFTYAVTVAMETAYATSEPAITIYTGDRTGTNYPVTSTMTAGNRATSPSIASYIEPGAGASFVVLSHGPDRRGAFPLKKSAVDYSYQCTSDNANRNDVENCDDSNATFWESPYNDGTVMNSFFDDYIVWSSNWLDRPNISTAGTTCTGGCEAWCAPCAGTTTDLPSGAPLIFGSTATLCKKIITSPAPCQATCIWAGTAGTNVVRCP
jgi:prepilin-type N-terminal cleavage/methylation domain-containing protein